MNSDSTATTLTESFTVYYIDDADPCQRKVNGINISLKDFATGDTGISTGLVGSSGGGGVVSQTEVFDSMIDKIQIFSQLAADYEISGIKVTTEAGSTYEFGGITGCTAQDEITINMPVLSMEFAYTGTNKFQSIRWYFNSGYCLEGGSLSFDSSTSSYDYDASSSYVQNTPESLLDVTYASTCSYTPYYSATLPDDTPLPSYIVFDASTKVFTVSNNDKSLDGTSIDIKVTVGLGDVLFDVQTLTINILDPCDSVSLSGVGDETQNWNLNSQPRTLTWSNEYVLSLKTDNSPGTFDNDYCGSVIVAIDTLGANDPFIYTAGPASSISMTSATYLDEGVYNYQIYGYLEDHPLVETVRANMQITVMDPCDNTSFDTATVLADETWPISSTNQAKTLDLPTTNTACEVGYSYSITPNTLESNAEVLTFTRTAPQAYAMAYRCNLVTCDGTYTVTISATLLHDTSVTFQKSFTLTIGSGGGCSASSFTLTSAVTLSDVVYQQIGSYSYDPVFTYAPGIDCGEVAVHSFTQSSVDGVTLSSTELAFTESTASFAIDISNPAYYGTSVDIVLRADITGFYVETNFKIRIEDPCALTTFVGQSDITINYTLLDPVQQSSPINLQTQLEIDHSLATFYCGNVLVTSEQVTTNTPISSFSEVAYDQASQIFSAYTNNPSTSVGTLTFDVELKLQSHPTVTETFQVIFNIVSNNSCQNAVPNSQNLDQIVTIKNLNGQTLSQFDVFNSGLLDMSACGSQTYQVVDEQGLPAGDFISYTDDFNPLLYLTVDSNLITQTAGVYQYYIKMTLDSYPGFEHLEPFNVVILQLIDQEPQVDRTSYVDTIDEFSLTPWQLKPTGYCTINYSTPNLPSFITFYESTLTFKVEATLSEEVGEYTLQIQATLDDCFSPREFSMMSQEWKVTVEEGENPFVIDINSPPFFTGNFEPQQAKVGAAWRYTLPEASDPDDDEITYNVNLGAAEEFMIFNQDSKSLLILVGDSLEDHVGQYTITISLVDSEGNQSEDSNLSFDLLTSLVEEELPKEEEEAEEENKIEETTEDKKVEQEFDVLKQFEWDWQQRDVVQWEPDSFEARKPRVQIKKVSPYGQLELEFDKIMQVPKNITIYEDFFKDNRDNSFKPILEINVVPGYQSFEQNLTFSWEVHSYEEDTLTLQLYFDNAIYVSANTDPEEIELKFNFEKGFTDIYNVHIEEDVTLKRIIPQQLQIDEEAKKFTETISAMQSGATAVMAGNFVTNLFMSASLNQLWSLINTQQIIVMFPLIKITQPANSMLFFNFVMQIAAFDIIPTDGFYYEFFNLPVTEPLTVNFESIGFESAWFITNLGSMALFMTLFPLILIMICFTKCCMQYDRVKRFQNKLKRLIFWNSTITMLMESYAILCLCSMVNVKMYSWKTIEESSQTVVAILVLIFCTVIPFVFWYLFYKHFEKANSKEAKEKYGALYQDLDFTRRDKGRKVILQPVFFMARRLILSASVVWLLDHLWAQSFIIAMQSVFGVIMIGHVEPYIKTRNKMEYFNEIMIMVAMYHFLCFTDFVGSIETKYTVGYSLIGMVALHISVNLLLMIFGSLYQVKMNYMRWRSISMYNKIRERRLSMRNQRYPRQRPGRRRRNLSRRNGVRAPPPKLPNGMLSPIREIPTQMEIDNSPIRVAQQAAKVRRNQIAQMPNNVFNFDNQDNRQQEEEVKQPEQNQENNLILESLSSNDYFSPRKLQSYLDMANQNNNSAANKNLHNSPSPLMQLQPTTFTPSNNLISQNQLSDETTNGRSSVNSHAGMFTMSMQPCPTIHSGLKQKPSVMNF